MKQFILSLLCAVILFLTTSPPAPTAKAEPTPANGSYACILVENAYLYATSNERSGLFLIPKTYYVKALEVQGEFTKVEYSTDSEYTKKLTGYCKTAQLTFVDYVPSEPYFYTTFELVYRIDDSDKRYPFLTEITVTCAYYGEYPIDSFLGYADGPYIGVEVQFSAEGHIGAFHFSAHRSGGGAFEQHIAGLDLGHYILWHGFSQCQTILDDQTLNFLNTNLARCDFVCKELI